MLQPTTITLGQMWELVGKEPSSPKDAYRALSRALGGMKGYGRNRHIFLSQLPDLVGVIEMMDLFQVTPWEGVNAARSLAVDLAACSLPVLNHSDYQAALSVLETAAEFAAGGIRKTRLAPAHDVVVRMVKDRSRDMATQWALGAVAVASAPFLLPGEMICKAGTKAWFAEQFSGQYIDRMAAEFNAMKVGDKTLCACLNKVRKLDVASSRVDHHIGDCIRAHLGRFKDAKAK
ncbi:MAG: hypothetical protein DHS20C01_37810 [marine bacterium B5-7]|nr:MAG: hypothetical protein DHS20C01_37810 [marine bacterium B5-7]